MSASNDGGPAFPWGDQTRGEIHGMSLRDWFAGQALAGICADVNGGASLNAECAYRQADAMLKAREVTP